MAKILVVEDDEDGAAALEAVLSSYKHTVEVVFDGIDAQQMIRAFDFDVIVLDWNLPGLSGPDILREIKTKTKVCRVLMLTARAEFNSKDEAFKLGADDYLTKPYDAREVILRVAALMRRPDVVLDVLSCADLILNPSQHSLSKQGHAITLQPRDFQLLEFLMRHPNQFFSTESLLQRVWNLESEASADGLRSSIKRIRQAIDGPHDSLIETIPRIGYRIKA